MIIWKNAVMGYLGGLGYMALELLWRGWTHGSMFLLGGLCFVLIGNLDRLFQGMPLLFQSVLGAGIITFLELLTGLVLNVWLGLGVWDYSSLPYSFLGQISMTYFFLWIFVALGAVFLEDGLRRGLFGDARPHYRVI